MVAVVSVTTSDAQAPHMTSGATAFRGAHTGEAPSSPHGGRRTAVLTWKQCSVKVLAYIASMPRHPGAGASCAAIACSECLQAYMAPLVPGVHAWRRHAPLHASNRRDSEASSTQKSLVRRRDAHQMLASRSVSFRFRPFVDRKSCAGQRGH